MVGFRALGASEPRQVRKEAALRIPSQVPRFCLARASDAGSSRGNRFDGGTRDRVILAETRITSGRAAVQMAPITLGPMPGIRRAATTDAERCAALAEEKREQYESYAPVFHRPKAGARELHAAFLTTLIEDEEKISLVHDAEDDHVDGFLIAILTAPPPVYDPGGLTCVVDDFVVESPELWASVGRQLLEDAIEAAKRCGAVQSVVVCGPHDEPKRTMLLDSGHIVTSEWLTKPFEP
jgi:GNAT superfamily N-acetyltransferase